MCLGIILTLIVGFFFLIGIVILNNSKNKEKLSIFTISMAFIVMLGLILFHLMPELIEQQNPWLLIPVIIGFSILIVLDKFIPHHHHEHTEKHCNKIDHEKHLNHIGILTIIALAIHNIIEGISLYSISLNDTKSALLMTISIGLHNIPLGFQIGNSLNKKHNKLLISFLCLSSLLGALLMILFNGLNEVILSSLLSLTIGMLIYILIFELFNEFRKNLRKKEAIYGTIVGLLLVLLTSIL